MVMGRWKCGCNATKVGTEADKEVVLIKRGRGE